MPSADEEQHTMDLPWTLLLIYPWWLCWDHASSLNGFALNKQRLCHTKSFQKYIHLHYILWLLCLFQTIFYKNKQTNLQQNVAQNVTFWRGVVGMWKQFRSFSVCFMTKASCCESVEGLCVLQQVGITHSRNKVLWFHYFVSLIWWCQVNWSH